MYKFKNRLLITLLSLAIILLPMQNLLANTLFDCHADMQNHQNMVMNTTMTVPPINVQMESSSDENKDCCQTEECSMQNCMGQVTTAFTQDYSISTLIRITSNTFLPLTTQHFSTVLSTPYRPPIV